MSINAKIKRSLSRGLRQGLKYTLNPLTRRLAKTRFGPFALIRHVGRRSGKVYETPILTAALPDGVVLELTYGPQVDWYQNILAAGGGTIVWHGQATAYDQIEPLDCETGRAAFPLPAQFILRLLRRTHYVKLSVRGE